MAKKFALQEKSGSYATQRGLAARFWGDEWWPLRTGGQMGELME